MGIEDITADELEKAIKSFVTIETASQISRRNVRTQLEQIFNLEENALYERKKEINEILNKILKELLEEDEKQKGSEENTDCTNKNDSKTNDQEKEVQNEKPQKSSSKDKINKIVKKEKENDNDSASSSSESNTKNKNSSKKRKQNLPENIPAKKRQANVMTKDYFMENAETLCCNLTEDIQLKLEPRVFNTGSCGWHMMDKIYLSVGDHDVLCQLCINCSVIGSKQWN
ncbi:conserved Plasmodium protein, unknown function [Plasmodium chabaudi chabaudi]|uniref:DEK-C domain-containing protein n=1 Tax=Plasmodium chabaudi chabaudi TaxID=31271 RepID=A0A077YDW0_PLACU|nr:conserved protein, unknown function [Plasmodium chabaudi chabaudi]SCM05027.1 conserved Plasmodium protein, unknown function [Plasmodium chabaudi chabaudi]VTZ66594.1 conserved protein, unknown function [Plasmodium chabaudi chabaudi]|eukprot:XP_016655610.1 conserved Plasmodium protein, unknown function [Plasmodium chabaudi chabaudi]